MSVPAKRDSVVTRARVRSEYENMRLDPYQRQAGDTLQELYYKSHYGVPAMDPSKTPVDGGKPPVDIPDHVIDCQNKIGRAAREIGKFNFAVLHKYVCEEKGSEDVAFDFSETGDRAQKFYRRLCIIALTDLARHWNIERQDNRRSSYFHRDTVLKVIPDEWVRSEAEE